MLTEKAKEQEALIADFEEREKEYQELDSEAQLLRTQNESMREDSMSMGKEIELLEDRLEMGEKEKAELMKNKMKLERILAEAALSMHRILKVRPGVMISLVKVGDILLSCIIVYCICVAVSCIVFPSLHRPLHCGTARK